MMTLEEAIKALRLGRGIEINGNAVRVAEFLQGLDVAISALHPVSREQVEKVWRGEWIVQQGEHSGFIKKCSKCGLPISGWWGENKFCANCGAPMTNEAVQMVMEKLEALYEDNG